MRAAKVQASLRIRAVSPEPPLLAHTSIESRGTFRQKTRSLALLSCWACAVKICHDGMLEDTNSLDGAHLMCLMRLMVYNGETFIMMGTRRGSKHCKACKFLSPFAMNAILIVTWKNIWRTLHWRDVAISCIRSSFLETIRHVWNILYFTRSSVDAKPCVNLFAHPLCLGCPATLKPLSFIQSPNCSMIERDWNVRRM